MRKYDIDIVIDSGRARGQSAYMFAKYLPNNQIHSIEKHITNDEVFAQKRLKNFENVICYIGDSVKLIPKIIEQNEDKRIGILLDGPKGFAAIDFLSEMFGNSNVIVGMIHDMRKLDHGKPSPYRVAATKKFKDCAFTDDPRIEVAISWVDDVVIAQNGPVGLDHKAAYGSYGPTLGIFLNL
jgi:hypothetical protein